MVYQDIASFNNLKGSEYFECVSNCMSNWLICRMDIVVVIIPGLLFCLITTIVAEQKCLDAPHKIIQGPQKDTQKIKDYLLKIINLLILVKENKY